MSKQKRMDVVNDTSFLSNNDQVDDCKLALEIIFCAPCLCAFLAGNAAELEALSARHIDTKYDNRRRLLFFDDELRTQFERRHAE